MSLGLFLSAFARTEFQAVQFMPAFVLPQILLCGLLVPRDEMAGFARVDLERAAAHLRLRRAAARAARDAISADACGSTSVVIAGGNVLALVLGAATLRRRTA